jgi:hypothetical protein
MVGHAGAALLWELADRLWLARLRAARAHAHAWAAGVTPT